MKKHWISILITGMALGTAWAVRGQFGHEQGAAWAGGIGALAFVMVAGRKDWNARALTVSLASAIGWGVGGMISYGQIVGYGRSDDFWNASYGLLMLFFIGGLYGLTGGGLVGLSLSSTRKKKVKWASLLAEMTAGGIIAYYFLIEQLGLRMTPPRSEAWAACFGAGVSMIWFMARHHYTPALRVALISALGAGFGFAFGNFLQTLGAVLEIRFNMWNVMEYAIGFCGGSSMAYGIFTSKWPDETETEAVRPWENKWAFAIVFILFPVLVFQQSPALSDPFAGDYASSQPEGNGTLSGSLTALVLLAAMTGFGWSKAGKISRKPGMGGDLRYLFVAYLSVYILFSYLVSGAFKGIFLLNHHLYIINLMVILFLTKKHFPAFSEKLHAGIKISKWSVWLVILILSVLILSFISISIHGEMAGSNIRF